MIYVRVCLLYAFSLILCAPASFANSEVTSVLCLLLYTPYLPFTIDKARKNLQIAGKLNALERLVIA